MKFSNYKKILVALIATTALILGLYLEAKIPDTPTTLNIDTHDKFLLHGLRTGKIACNDKVSFQFEYDNKTSVLTTAQICGVLDDTRKTNL